MVVRSAVASVLIKNWKNNLWYSVMVTDCVQVDLKFSVIQTELGLNELNQGLPGKKTNIFFFKCETKIMLSWSQTHKITTLLLQLIQSVMYLTGLDYISRALILVSLLYFNNGQMQLPHFAECYLKGTTPSRNTAPLATITQSEPKCHLLTFSIIDVGDYVQPRHLKMFFFSFFIFWF